MARSLLYKEYNTKQRRKDSSSQNCFLLVYLIIRTEMKYSVLPVTSAALHLAHLHANHDWSKIVGFILNGTFFYLLITGKSYS